MDRGEPDRRRTVVVVGNSTTYTVAPRRSSREEQPWPEVLRDALTDSGHAVTVLNFSRWFGLVGDANRQFEDRVRSHLPDVVVAAYGTNECQPQVIPNRLTRHLLRWNVGQGGVNRHYRELLLPKAWPPLRRYQTRVAGRTGTLTWRMTPPRAAAELTLFINAVTAELAVPVFVLGFPPPTRHYADLLPHAAERRNRMQAALRAATDNATGVATFVDVEPLVTALGGEAAVPDGMHYTAAAHRAVGELLARHIARQFSAERDPPVGGSAEPPS